MTDQLKWKQREFQFNFPLGIFRSILERLRGTPARLESIVESPPQSALTKKVNGKWSIQEHVGHLFDLEELHEGRLDDYRVKLKILRPADMTNRKTTEANHNANSIQNLLRQFRESRERFIHRLEELDETEIAAVSMHPRLRQPMRVVDMAYFVAEHDDHHLARITELIRILHEET